MEKKDYFEKKNYFNADTWKDESSRLAPAIVREAADDLWNTVERESRAALEVGYGVKKKVWNFNRVCCDIMCCCSAECFICCTEFDKFGFDEGVASVIDQRGKQAAYEQRTAEVMKSLQTLQLIVNESVSRPEQYSGDANVCAFGPWVEDSVWSVTVGTHETVSAHRGLSNIPKSVIDFVNKHGGWAPFNMSSLKLSTPQVTTTTRKHAGEVSLPPVEKMS